MQIEYKGAFYKSPTAHKKIATEIAKDFCAEQKICFKEILQRRGPWELVMKRVTVARHLLNFGFSTPTVGYVLNKHHSAIVNYKKERYNSL